MLDSKHGRRDQISIAASILECSRGCTLKTQIMYKANLSFAQLNSYLAFLVEKGLITQSITNGKERYSITEKGVDFLRKHQELTKMLQTHNAAKAPVVQQSLL